MPASFQAQQRLKVHAAMTNLWAWYQDVTSAGDEHIAAGLASLIVETEYNAGNLYREHFAESSPAPEPDAEDLEDQAFDDAVRLAAAYREPGQSLDDVNVGGFHVDYDLRPPRPFEKSHARVAEMDKLFSRIATVRDLRAGVAIVREELVREGSDDYADHEINAFENLITHAETKLSQRLGELAFQHHMELFGNVGSGVIG